MVEIQRQLPELEKWFVEWDCPVAGGCSLKRPDMLWELPYFYFHLEVDEHGNSHEDDRGRLIEIQNSMGTHRPGFVLRVNSDKLLRKLQHTDGELKYTPSKYFKQRKLHSAKVAQLRCMCTRCPFNYNPVVCYCSRSGAPAPGLANRSVLTSDPTRCYCNPCQFVRAHSRGGSAPDRGPATNAQLHWPIPNSRFPIANLRRQPRGSCAVRTHFQYIFFNI